MAGTSLDDIMKLKVGDKVWLANVYDLTDPNDGKAHPEWIREPQIVSEVDRVPVTGNDPYDYTLCISIHGIPYIFNETDIQEVL